MHRWPLLARRRFLGAAAAAFLGGMLPVGRAVAVVAPGTKPKVVATFSILGDWARVVGGTDIDETTLVGPDGDPHEYEPVPADSVAVGRADVILENGLALEHWLDKLCTAADATGMRVVVTNGIDVRHVPQGEGDRPNGKDDDRDPHAWQSVRDAELMVDHIRDALVQVDPAHAAGYASRAAAYQRQLEALDRYAMQQVHSIPANHRKLVTSHDAFGYFGQRYGMDVSRSALESVTTEAADPSAQQIAAVVDQIKASGVPVIFLENIQNPKLINQLAAEAGVTVGPPLYSDALGKPGTGGDTYLKMMRSNVDALARALRP